MNDAEFLELSKSDFDLYMEMPVCGCGYMGEVYDIYRTLLRTADSELTGWPTREERLAPFDGNEVLYDLAAGVLDHIGATEHGGSITYAWITDKGRQLLSILDRYAASDYDAMPCGELHPPTEGN